MRFFFSKGRVLMEVTPVKELFKSGMVHDVITTNGKFVVDMNTGELTIHRPEQVPLATTYHWIRPNDTSRRLSAEFDVAKLQIQDEYTTGEIAGARFTYVRPNGEGEDIKADPNLAKMMRRVKEVYQGK